MNVVLERFLASNEGVFGSLTVGGCILFTMEEQWQNNAHGVSCIPGGTYVLRKHFFAKMALDTYEIAGVPNRSGILIHPANTEEDVEGCVAPGLSLGVIAVRQDENTGRPAKKLAVLQSRVAFKKFMDAMAGADNVPIVVRWASAVNPEK
jgi:hypothetical protein